MSHPNLAMLPRNPLRFAPPLALAIGAFALASGSAHAAALKPITISAPVISAPTVKTVGHDLVTGAPIEEITARARVRFNPVILTTYSGAALLKDDVAEAARKACDSIDPLSGNRACVQRAIESSRPQVTAAITRARTAEPG